MEVEIGHGGSTSIYTGQHWSLLITCPQFPGEFADSSTFSTRMQWAGKGGPWLLYAESPSSFNLSVQNRSASKETGNSHSSGKSEGVPPPPSWPAVTCSATGISRVSGEGGY